MYQKKRIDKAKREAGVRATREAEEQRTKEWILERKRREQVFQIHFAGFSDEYRLLQEQLEKTEHDRQRKLGAMKQDADAVRLYALEFETGQL